MRWIETIGLDGAHGFRSVLVEMIPRSIESDGHHMSQIILVNTHLIFRVFQDPLQFALLSGNLFEADAFIIVHSSTCAGETLGIGLRLNGLGNVRGLTLTDATLRQSLCHALLDDLTDGAELIPDRFGLAHERIKDDVRLALLISEVTAGHEVCGVPVSTQGPGPLLPPTKHSKPMEKDPTGAGRLAGEDLNGW